MLTDKEVEALKQGEREPQSQATRIKELEEALKPFAKMHREGTDPSEIACQRGVASDMTIITSQDFAFAASVLGIELGETQRARR